MANAYTPGLKVSGASIILKQRRLPILGEILVEKGQKVTPQTPVARALISGNSQSVNVANTISCEATEVPEFMLKNIGDEVEKDEIIAKRSSFFGLFKSECKSPIKGKIDNISKVTGQIIVKEPPIAIQIDAYINGTVVNIIDKEEVTIETKGAFVQGIFGVGGERNGILKVIAKTPNDILDEKDIDDSCNGKIIIGGSLMTGAVIKKASSLGVKGIVTGGIIDKELIDYLGFDIGVAITGQEEIPLSLIVTEGFGKIPMAKKTFELLKSLEGKHASINGATQIRAGVMRPEIIVSNENVQININSTDESGSISPGTTVRCIREPYFGQIAEIVDLPAELAVIETGAKVRIMSVKLKSGEIVTIPRANVEVVEE